VIAKFVMKYARTCFPFATIVTATFETISELKILYKLVVIQKRCCRGERAGTVGTVKC
jgi:hypothetical protein